MLALYKILTLLFPEYHGKNTKEVKSLILGSIFFPQSYLINCNEKQNWMWWSWTALSSFKIVFVRATVAASFVLPCRYAWKARQRLLKRRAVCRDASAISQVFALVFFVEEDIKLKSICSKGPSHGLRPKYNQKKASVSFRRSPQPQSRSFFSRSEHCGKEHERGRPSLSGSSAAFLLTPKVLRNQWASSTREIEKMRKESLFWRVSMKNFVWYFIVWSFAKFDCSLNPFPLPPSFSLLSFLTYGFIKKNGKDSWLN